MARKCCTRINGGTKTKTAVFETAAEQWTPDWDKAASGQQAMDRNKARAKMGQKETPLGAGTLLKAKG